MDSCTHNRDFQYNSILCDIAPLIWCIRSLIVFKMYVLRSKEPFLIWKRLEGKTTKRWKPDQKSLSRFSYNSKEEGQRFLLFNIKGLIISLWHFLSAEGECLSLCVFNIISLCLVIFICHSPALYLLHLND